MSKKNLWWVPLYESELWRHSSRQQTQARGGSGEALETWPDSGSHTHQFVHNVITAFAKHRGSKLHRVFRPPGLYFSLLHRSSRVDLPGAYEEFPGGQP